ncbi:hypothetical protein VPNG_00709 [Cytospora leucostoma]|uniref:Uncharacterized protein n=1 Tax=Cytospora leucostoma TaxID=1230097 RepID=A0A423XNJ4_9PEZI|nr:hypothetical protein VPNG_00709 [Cytospora leucostoma]
MKPGAAQAASGLMAHPSVTGNKRGILNPPGDPPHPTSMDPDVPDPGAEY